MNILSTLLATLAPFWWVILLALILGFFNSSWFKGVSGEAKVKIVSKLRLPKDIYHPLHNVMLPTPDGTTQIDHIFVSCYGVFVLETKNVKGWIFGGERQREWTQKIFHESYKFQNPLRQNFKHVKALKAILDVPSETVHSVVAFVGRSTFKTPMPPNVTQGIGFIRYIKSFDIPVLTKDQVHEAKDKLDKYRLLSTSSIKRQHVQRIKARSNPHAERKCPKCGENMVLRTAKKGANAGNQFWGCSGYPNCKMVQNIT